MNDETGFHIRYENPRKPVPQPELYEGYDLESAFYDYLPSGTHAEICIDGYTLEMTDVKLVDLVRSCLPLAEQLSTLPANPSQRLRAAIGDVPPGVEVYSWLFGDFVTWLPVVIFATDGTMVWIYTRTHAETEGLPLVVWPERDRADPILVSRSAVIEEILGFLSRFLDDVSDAFPFLATDEMYLSYRGRIAALRRGAEGFPAESQLAERSPSRPREP